MHFWTARGVLVDEALWQSPRQAAEQQAVVEQHDLETQIVDLKAKITALKDHSYIRAEAKRRLQYVTPGDTVYVVKLPEGVTGPAVGSDAADAAASPGGVIGAVTSDATASAPDPSSSQPWYASLWGTLSGGES